MTKKEMEAQEAKWQAEGDCDTLCRAMEIKADKSRYAAARKVAAERIKQMKAVASK